MKVSFQYLKAVNEVFKRLNNLRRWTSFKTSASFDELSKQALNCVVSFILAVYSENAGRKINWTNFPKLALYRSFAKVHIYFDIPEYIMEDLCAIGKISNECFETAIKDVIIEETDSQFADFLCESLNTYEEQIFKASRRIATFVELEENKLNMNHTDYCTKRQLILKRLEDVYDIPGVREIMNVNSPLFKIFLKIATLRNQNRWAFLSYRPECSVLGHLFDTAVLAYFMSLELNPDDEKTATEMFFIGIYHDVAEAWTMDFVGPVKDRIPGLRKLTEEFELAMLEKYLYSQVPSFLEEKLRKVIMEDEENESVKPLMKGADYLSASSECWRQYVAGSNEVYFLDVIRENGEKIKNGKILMTPLCEKLYWYYRIFAESVTTHIPK